KLIIQFLFLRITQHSICLRDLFKFLLCFRVPRIHIRMIFFRKFPICFFNRCRVCPLGQSQHFIIISLHSHIHHPLISSTNCPSAVQLSCACPLSITRPRVHPG